MQGMPQILRVNLTRKKCVWEELPAGYGTLAGQSLSLAIVAREARPDTGPVGPDYPLVLTPATLGSLSRPADADLPVDGSSTLCGDHKGATIIGSAAEKLVRLGLAAIILEGVAKSPLVVSIFHNGITFHQAKSSRGIGGTEETELLRMRHPGSALITRSLTAGKQPQPDVPGVSRAADHPHEDFRGCPGEALGSKNVTALVIDDVN